MNFKLKTAGLAAGVAGMIMLTSAMSTSNVPLEVGNQAPNLSVSDSNGNLLSLSDLEGQNVILNFWSMSDAESRISNVRLLRDAERTGARFISMCVDSDTKLAEEVMRADNLPEDSRFFVDERAIDMFMLDEGVRTVKIDPYGIVAAID